MKYFGMSDFLALSKCLLKNEVAVFEKEISQYMGIKYVIGTGFGRTALYLGLRAIDVQGKEVIVPNFLCTVVRAAVLVAGAVPIFVDVDINNFSYNLKELQSKITRETKAIVLIHYFGRVARNLHDVINIAKQNNLILIEDCAHSLGAEYEGEKIGSFGDFSVFSLTKGMINCGGGFFASNSEELYNKARNILGECKKNLTKRIVDFPLVLEIGIQQYVEKVISLNPRYNVYRWIIIKLMKSFLSIRLYTLKLMKIPLLLSKNGKINENKNDMTDSKTFLDNRNIDSNYYIITQPVYMEPIIASLGRMQIRKLSFFIRRRREICKALAKLRNYHFINSEDPLAMDVYTHLVLRLPGADLLGLISRCKRLGILLKTTWPQNQDIWEDQDSAELRKIKNEILIWEINPMLHQRQIEHLIKTIEDF